MFLKNLTLKGFKSFAETTTLEFEPGITVVVGPNGSGKSNLVDAVAWVLGAQGPRVLRSARMEEVIFAGTSTRPALGRAEVSLTIDNSAGLLAIDFAEVTITRTLWRTGESEYALNGVPCRLLDIQELLSDTGVGRQQHVIVSQGQLDAVLNDHPTDRRLIIEEAAGVLKYRRRREKAQRRLEATEGDLLRVQDLVREVRRQLRPLERQAEAAQRHGAVVAELRALKLYLAGRELGAQRARGEAVTRRLADAAREESVALATLSRLDAAVAGGEAELSGSSGVAAAEQLADGVARAEGLRERARGLAAVLAERARALEQRRLVQLDQSLVAALESEAATVAAQHEEVTTEATRLAPAREELATAEAERAAELEAERAGSERAAPPGAGGAAEVRGELAALRGTVARVGPDRGRLVARLAGLEAKDARLAEEAQRLRTELSTMAAAERELVAAFDSASSQRAQAEENMAAAAESVGAATARHQAGRARAEALAMALDEARARAGAERLAGVAGLVGTLADMVEVDTGWEAAFEAAAGEAMAAVVMASGRDAKRALTLLHEQGATGAVLALEHGERDGEGPLSLPIEFPAAVPAAVAGMPGVSLVGEHVKPARPDSAGLVRSLLERLLASAVVVEGGWQDALELAIAHPTLVVVTRHGDRFAVGGWRAGTGAAGATRAAHGEARRFEEEARAAESAAAGELAAARTAVEQARDAEADAARALDRHDARHTSHTEALARTEGERREVATESDALRTQLDDLSSRAALDEARLAELEGLLPVLVAEEEAGAERASSARAQLDGLEQRLAAARDRRAELDLKLAGLEERRAVLAERLVEIEARLEFHRAERLDAVGRRVAIEAQARAVQRLEGFIRTRLERVEEALVRRREERRVVAEKTAAFTARLESLRRERGGMERELSSAREHVQRAELDQAELRVRHEAATEGLRREFDCEPDVAMAAECPELPAGASAEGRVRELERDLRLMGPVNPLAAEEFRALSERHSFLEDQLDDVKASRRELAKVIRAIDAEIVEVFNAAYADVSDNFSKLFAVLFPGGTGRLRLTDPENLLETGLEVEARPSGKNVKRLSLLSGGERALVALAFLFAVFRSRPSPFYLMDEVEAALDDVNLHRFLDLIAEFRAEAQLFIVSHQKRTMEAADCLYGITMQPAGASKVISQRVSAQARGG